MHDPSKTSGVHFLTSRQVLMPVVHLHVSFIQKILTSTVEIKKNELVMDIWSIYQFICYLYDTLFLVYWWWWKTGRVKWFLFLARTLPAFTLTPLLLRELLKYNPFSWSSVFPMFLFLQYHFFCQKSYINSFFYLQIRSSFSSSDMLHPFFFLRPSDFKTLLSTPLTIVVFIPVL